MQPKLAYVDIQISNSIHSPESQRYTIRALHDSGCAKTVIRTSAFMELAKRAKVTMKHNSNNTMLITATGITQAITGMADVVLHFEGLNGITMAFPIEIMVHPDLSQDFLLGRDFIGSEARSFESNDRMYLTQNPDKLEGSTHELVRRKLLCEVPLITKGTKAKYVATNTMLVIPPFSSISATCTMQKSPTQDYKLPLATVGSTTYEVLNSTYPKIETAKMLYTYQDASDIYIPLFNDTCKEITIPAGTTVAEIELWEENHGYEVHHMRVSEQDLEIMECNNANVIPDFILDDEGMNEEEQQEAFMKYIRFGYHHPSMTKQVEERAALTEMSLVPKEATARS